MDQYKKELNATIDAFKPLAVSADNGYNWAIGTCILKRIDRHLKVIWRIMLIQE
jgi:hypothetical protein